MTTDEQAQIADYVRVIADQLELKDWRFQIATKPCHEDYAAQIQCVYGRKRATITLGERWREESPEEHRHTIAHELIHCHLQPTQTVIANVASNLGDTAYGVLKGLHEDAVEFAVDALADAIAPFLPLPNEMAGEAGEAA